MALFVLYLHGKVKRECHTSLLTNNGECTYVVEVFECVSFDPFLVSNDSDILSASKYG